jgi:hypothetical protein
MSSYKTHFPTEEKPKSLEAPKLASNKHLMLLFIACVGVAEIGLTQCIDPSTDNAQFYVAYQLSSPEEIQFAQWVNEDLMRVLESDSLMNVDILKGDKAENLHNGPVDRRALKMLATQSLNEKEESSDKALIQAVQRAVNLALDKHQGRLNALIVSTGTSDPGTIRTIRYIAQTALKKGLKNFRLYLLGLSDSHKLPMAEGLKPLKAYLGGSCTQRVESCEEIIDSL